MKKYLISLALAALALAACNPESGKINPDETPNTYFTPVAYTEPSFPNSLGATTTSNITYGSTFEDVSQYVDDNLNGWANLVVEAGAGAIGSIVGKYTGKDNLNKLFVKVAGMFFDIDDEEKPSPEMVKMNEISSKIGEISSELRIISEEVGKTYKTLQEVELNTIFIDQQEFAYYLNSMFYLSNYYYFLLGKAKTEEEMIKVVQEWGDKCAGGGNPPFTVLAMADKLLDQHFKFNGGDINYLAAFDIYAYTEFPWESQGYALREAYRAEVATGMALSLNLAAMYYSITNYIQGIQVINSAYQQLKSYFRNSAVQHRNNMAVCQIAGAHFEMPKKPTIYNASYGGNAGVTAPDYIYNSNKFLRLMCENKYIGTWGFLKTLGIPSWQNEKANEDRMLQKIENTDCKAFIAGQFTASEMQAVMEFYKDKDWSFLRCLQEAGGVQGLEYYLSNPFQSTYQDYCWVATDKINLDVYAYQEKAKDPVEHRVYLNGYVLGTVDLPTFKQNLSRSYSAETEQWGWTRYVDDPENKAITHYPEYKLTRMFNIPADKFLLFFEPTEITRPAY